MEKAYGPKDFVEIGSQLPYVKEMYGLHFYFQILCFVFSVSP